MSKNALVIAILSSIACVSSALAQDAPATTPEAKRPGFPPPPPNRRMMSHPMESRGPIFAKMLSDADFLKELNLPEDIAKTLTENLVKLNEKESNLQEKRRAAMRSQTELLAGLLSDRNKTAEEAKKVLEESEKCQKELSELMIDRLILIRDTLTDDQIKQASELVKKRFEERRKEFMNRHGRNGEGPQRGPEGKRMTPRHGREGFNGKGPGPAVEKAPPAPQEGEK